MSPRKKAEIASSDLKKEKFYRIKEHDLLPGDVYKGYQPEVIEIEGDKVVSRSLIDKPNLFEYAQTHLIDLIDPRNHVENLKVESI